MSTAGRPSSHGLRGPRSVVAVKRPGGWNTLMQEMEIQLNGEKLKVACGATLADLVRQLELAEDRVAVELDRRIVRRGEWPSRALRPGASVEIVQIVGGG